MTVGCELEAGWVHRKLRRGDHLGYALDQGHHKAMTPVLYQPVLGLAIHDARGEAEPRQ